MLAVWMWIFLLRSSSQKPTQPNKTLMMNHQWIELLNLKWWLSWAYAFFSDKNYLIQNVFVHFMPNMHSSLTSEKKRKKWNGALNSMLSVHFKCTKQSDFLWEIVVLCVTHIFHNMQNHIWVETLKKYWFEKECHP